MRGLTLIAVTVLVGCGTGERSPETADVESLAPALDLYSQGRLVDALPLFQAAAEANPGNPDTHAWVAETARRLRHFELVASETEAALAIDTCHGFTHTVLGDAYRPELSNWDKVDRDSSWAHFMKAVDCDPTDGNPWIGIWTAALQRGDRAMEERALRRLMETGFLTPSVLAFNRWVLRSLPDKAVLITNGDWDTYPALALQLVDGVRTDVAIVNRSLLNLLWYADLKSERHGLALPLPRRDLEEYRPRRDQAGAPVLLSDLIIGTWAQLKDLTGRPLVFAPTVDMHAFSANPRLQYAGAHWRLTAEAGGSLVDRAATRAAMSAIVAREFAAPEVSPQDRSAVRRAAARGRGIAKVVLYTAVPYVEAALTASDRAGAEDAVRWAERFADEAGLLAEHRGLVDSLRAMVREGG